MKKVITLLFIFLFSISLSACNNNNNAKDSTTQIAPRIASYELNSVEELIEWINTVDADNFAVQNRSELKGQFKGFISEIRKDEHILVPMYNNKFISLRNEQGFNNISIRPDAQYEERCYGYRAIIDDVRININIKYIDDAFIEVSKNGLDDYLKAKWKTSTTEPTTIENWKRDPKIKKMYLKDFNINGKLKKCRITEETNETCGVEFILDSYIVKIGFLQPANIEEILKNISFETIKLKK